MSLLTRKQQWRRCRYKRRAESCDASMYDDLLKALHAPADRQLHKVASAPELHTLSQANTTQQAQPAVAAAAAAVHEPSAVASCSEKSEVPPVHRPKKRVRFGKVVNVILIPTRKEYEEVKLNRELWWDDDDYLQFKLSAMEEYIRHMQKKQLRQERAEQQEALAATIQQKLSVPVEPGPEPEAEAAAAAETEEHSPEQRRSMKHVDSIVLTQSQQAPIAVQQDEQQNEQQGEDSTANAAVDELFLSDCHTDGSTEASSVDEHDDPEQPISDCGSPDLDDQQHHKRFSGSDSDSSDLIHHLDSLDLQRTPSNVRKASVAGFQELEEFLRHHAASYEWRCIPHSQQAVMI